MATIECPVCEFPSPKPCFELGDRFFGTTADRFTMYDCSACGLRFLDPGRVEFRLDSFYPPGYWWEPEPGWSSGLQGAYRTRMVRWDQLAFLRKRIGFPAGETLLDVGCGSGLFVQLAAEAGLDAWGLENSAGAVHAAGKAGNSRVLSASLEDLASGGISYGIVTLFHCLEHVLNPFRFLRQVQKVLRKPGHLLVQVPNLGSWQARLFGRNWYGLDCPRHVCNYRLYSLLYLLGRTGFRIRAVRHYSPRDNAAAIVSSLLPGLDPLARRVRAVRELGHVSPRARSGAGFLPAVLYFGLVQAAQSVALLEAAAGKGGSVMVHATWDV